MFQQPVNQVQPHGVVNVSQNALLTFNQMAQVPAQNPPPEVLQPQIFQGVRRPRNVTVIPYAPGEPCPPIYLMRNPGSSQAYAMIEKQSRDIGNHGQGQRWGRILFAVIYYRIGSPNMHVFQCPRPGDAQYVAIKQVNKQAVAAHQGHENPRTEIARMQQLGDNVHVIRCIEALEDDEWLYIVTPMAQETLSDVIASFTPDPMPAQRAHYFFFQLLEIIAYLERNGVSHCDLKPDNLLVLPNDNLVVLDLALSLRNPTDANGNRVLTNPQGPFGSLQWMSPEVWTGNRVFDGLSIDLWAAGVILYNMLTGRILYEIPFYMDLPYRFFIMAEALNAQPLGPLALEMLWDAPEETEDMLLIRRNNYELLAGPAGAEVVSSLLRGNVSDRWNLVQAIQSNFVGGFANIS